MALVALREGGHATRAGSIREGYEGIRVGRQVAGAGFLD